MNKHTKVPKPRFYNRIFRSLLASFAILALLFSAGPAVHAQNRSNNDNIGKVLKGRNSSALYYIDEDGGRRVFPNEGTYRSWYSDFNSVVEVDDDELADYPLRGNVRYRPGSFLVKVQTDPKVYAVDQNGELRWIKTEEIAKDLYGDNWNKLIDDIPPAFFVNYKIGSLIDEISDFDPVLAQEIETVSENLRQKIQEKVQERMDNARLRYCERMEKHLDKLNDRLVDWDLEITQIGDDFVDRCVNNYVGDDDDDGGDEDEDEDDDKDDNDYYVGRKVRICHVTGNDSHTIIVSKSAARAHLMHGDTLGVCDAEDEDDNEEPADTTAPVISGISADTTATSTVITWTTDEASDSMVEYATSSLETASTTETEFDSSEVTSHSVTLSGLLPETTYYYVVKSEDAAGNLATSTEMMFTTEAIVIPDTTAPVISGVGATPSTTTAMIMWTTDEAADSRIEYATSSVVSATTTYEVTDAAFVTDHSFNLTDLATSTMYYFIVESADAEANSTTSVEQTFTTL